MSAFLVGVQGDDTARSAMLLGVQADATPRSAMLVGVFVPGDQITVDATLDAIAENTTSSTGQTLTSVATCAAGESTGIGVSSWLEYAAWDTDPDTLRVRMQVGTPDGLYATAMADVHSDFIGWDQNPESGPAFSLTHEVHADGAEVGTASIDVFDFTPANNDHLTQAEIDELYVLHDFRLTVTGITARLYYGTTLIHSWTAGTTPPSDWVSAGHIEIRAVMRSSWTESITQNTNYITADAVITRDAIGVWSEATPTWTGSDQTTGYDHAIRSSPVTFGEV